MIGLLGAAVPVWAHHAIQAQFDFEKKDLKFPDGKIVTIWYGDPNDK